jgi:hypothetical protein
MSVANRDPFIRRANILHAVGDRAGEVYDVLRFIRAVATLPVGEDAQALSDIRIIVTETLAEIHRLVGVDDLHGEPL